MLAPASMPSTSSARPARKDGLYWPSAPGEEESPLGRTVRRSFRQGYRTGEGRSPYHGYYYKILTKQGPAAPGGAADYVVNGKMIGGFALVAYPAEYRNSGVMTFVVNYAGTVFQKDLGHDTADIAANMTSFNPDQRGEKSTLPRPKTNCALLSLTQFTRALIATLQSDSDQPTRTLSSQPPTDVIISFRLLWNVPDARALHP